MSSRADQAPPASVAAVVLAGDGAPVAETVAAIRSQVYETARIVLVDGDESAATGDLRWFSDPAAAFDDLGPDVSHVWLLRAGARPRRDALRALIADSARAGADLAGSKILDGENEELLVSVGLATDSFGMPYLGLDEGEVDAGQYDVVRDVAAVDATSMLIRRDLLKGLGGLDPLMPIGAAAIDLCQRARLRSVRVVVVPSSEVPFTPGRQPAEWFEEAGRVRSLIKAYSPLTLVWALPIAFLIGLFEAIAAPLVGRWTAFSFVTAWSLNILLLPSTLLRRWRARKGNVVGDAELYRYQLRGSAKLRRLREDVSARILRRLGAEEGANLTELAAELRSPSFLAAAFGAAFVALATRSLWAGGFPATGFSLPLSESGPDALGAYAGGWNPGGFGSSEQLPPFVGFAGLVQTILFDNAELATAALVVGAFGSGIWGMTRLLRTWAFGPVAGVAAGIMLLAGPAAQAIADDTNLGVLVALGALPWALRVPLLRWPGTWRRRAGRLAGAGVAAALVGVNAPLLLLVAPAMLLVWAAISFNRPDPWKAVAVSIAGSVLALPVLLPWWDAVHLRTYLNAGEAFWEPGRVAAAVFAIAFAATMAAVPPRMAQFAAWGAVAITGGAILARSGDAGPGREVEHLGLALVTLGGAFVVGLAVEGSRRVTEITGWRRLSIGIGTAAAVVVAGWSLAVLVPGRAGLPGPELEDRIGFTAAAEGTPEDSRILLIGPADSLPGESRVIRGAAYRVISAPTPALWEAWLPTPRPADAALHLDLEALIDGEAFRGGEMLAAYGIRWVVSMGDTPLEDVFAAQLDLLPLPVREGVAFVYDGEIPERSVSEDGSDWVRTTAGYDGESDDGRVWLAESFDPAWGPQAEPDGWALSVSAEDGTARFEPRSKRRSQVQFAGGFFVFLVLAAFVGRRRS